MTKKYFVMAAITLTAAALVILGGCKQKSGEAAAAGARDLGGISIIIGHDYVEYDVDTYQPKNAYEEKVLAWRKQIQKDYNFSIKQVNFGMDQYMEGMVASIMAGDPKAQIIYFSGVMQYYNQGLLFPLDTIPGVDFDATEPVNWNQDLRRFFTFPDGHTYAFTPGYGLGGRNYGLYFNKRILAEAGYTADQIYDMQKNGTWTWDVFREICRKVTQDTDNDGQIDVYAIHTGSIAFAAAASNNAAYIDKDSRGYFIQTMQSPNVLEALQFVRGLMVDGFVDGWVDTNNFMSGKIAFLVEQEGQDFSSMRDDFGYVLFPKGPRAADYRAIERDDYYVMPATLSPAEAQKIMQGYMLWMQTPPTVSADDWKASFYPLYRDSRAVDETVAMFRDGKHYQYQYERLIGGHPNDVEQRIDKLDRTPAQAIEQVIQVWTDKLAEANRLVNK